VVELPRALQLVQVFRAELKRIALEIVEELERTVEQRFASAADVPGGPRPAAASARRRLSDAGTWRPTL
jgi:hypothetical protein